MNDIIVIPDIHGRTFWKKVKNDNSNSTIVFLGDYLDPYTSEKISFEDAFANLEEIIDFALKRKNVILLIGNHDYPYYFNTGNLGWSRYNHKFALDAHDLFLTHKELFSIAYQYNNLLFTHAGVEKEWYNKCVKNKNCGNISEQLQDLFLNNPRVFEIVGRSRGGYFEFGSPIWTDFYDLMWQENLIPNIKQYVGHTMGIYLRSNMAKNIYCLDCQKIFKVNSTTIIEY